MAHRFCPACRKLLAASGAVVFFGNALVHAACWSELRKPPGKAAMDSSGTSGDVAAASGDGHGPGRVGASDSGGPARLTGQPLIHTALVDPRA